MVVFCGRSSYDYKIEKLRKNDDDTRASQAVRDVHRTILNFINPAYEIYPAPPRKGKTKDLKH